MAVGGNICTANIYVWHGDETEMSQTEKDLVRSWNEYMRLSGKNEYEVDFKHFMIWLENKEAEL